MMYGVIWNDFAVELFQANEHERREFERCATRGSLKGAYLTENYWEAYACCMKVGKGNPDFRVWVNRQRVR